jgi:hypothetical protein
MSEPIRAYVNGHGVDLASGSTALDAVRSVDPEMAERVAAGERALTDSRGLPLAPDTVLAAGSILRIVSGRRREREGE